MKVEQKFYRSVLHIALPVTLQSLLQSSFQVIDQFMTGQLGSISIAGIGLGSKFSSIYSVVLSAIAAVAGIMIAQYVGKREDREISRSLFVNLLFAAILAMLFMIVSVKFPKQIMGLYTEDAQTGSVGAQYLKIVAAGYFPSAVTLLLSTFLRCIEAAKIPLYVSVVSVIMNTGLNYILIFGKLGFPKMGVSGAAIATAISQVTGCILLVGLFLRHYQKQNIRLTIVFHMERNKKLQYIGMLLPILACEFFWSLGENVYTAIYGHMGTISCAAMTLTLSVQVLVIGALNGVAQAAGVIVGKTLGREQYDKAYAESKKLMIYGWCASVVLSVVLLLIGRNYVEIFKVEEAVKTAACGILAAFAVIAPIKVQNMILGGGILRSGGKTNYVMIIDFIGTWIFGVPFGLLSAFVWKLSIPYVYFLLSMEECVRLGISLAVFRNKKWMRSLR